MAARAHLTLVLEWTIARVINGISLHDVSMLVVCQLMLLMELAILSLLMCCILLCQKSFNIFVFMLHLHLYSQIFGNCFILTTYVFIITCFRMWLITNSSMLLWRLTLSMVD